jgi:hypothetical protein
MSKQSLELSIVSPKNIDLILFRQNHERVEYNMTDKEKKLHFQQEINSEYVIGWYMDQVVACVRFIDWSSGTTYLQKHVNVYSHEYDQPTIEVSRLLIAKDFRQWNFTVDFLREAARHVNLVKGFEAFLGYGGKLESRLYQCVGAREIGHSFTVQRGEQSKKLYIFSGLMKNCYETQMKEYCANHK